MIIYRVTIKYTDLQLDYTESDETKYFESKKEAYNYMKDCYDEHTKISSIKSSFIDSEEAEIIYIDDMKQNIKIEGLVLFGDPTKYLKKGVD